MPQPRYAHAACIVGQEIVIAGGTSDLMLNMGMRSVPIGEPDCHSFNIFTNAWRRLPDVPIGKLHSTLIVINSRFIFQIGGFDDYNYEIYRLDMRKPEKAWKTLSLDKTVPIVDDSIRFRT